MSGLTEVAAQRSEHAAALEDEAGRSIPLTALVAEGAVGDDPGRPDAAP